ncbi:antirepressor KilAC domain-containing protein [Acinetobacter phage Ab69]|nr:antirepressor KilAC domain-containing protein [Acinetobacter phage Ab69]
MKVYDKRQKGRVFQQWFIDKGYGELKKNWTTVTTSQNSQNKGKQWIIEKFVRGLVLDEKIEFIYISIIIGLVLFGIFYTHNNINDIRLDRCKGKMQALP